MGSCPTIRNNPQLVAQLRCVSMSVKTQLATATTPPLGGCTVADCTIAVLLRTEGRM